MMRLDFPPVGELVNRLRLMQTGQPQMIIRTVYGDVSVAVFFKSGH